MKFLVALIALTLLAFVVLFFASIYVVFTSQREEKHKVTQVKKPKTEPLGETVNDNGIEVQQGILMS